MYFTDLHAAQSTTTAEPGEQLHDRKGYLLNRSPTEAINLEDL